MSSLSHVEQRLQQELGELLMDCPALSVVKQQVLESMMDMEGPCSPEELHERDTAARECMAEISQRFDPMEEFIEQIEDPTSKRSD